MAFSETLICRSDRRYCQTYRSGTLGAG